MGSTQKVKKSEGDNEISLEIRERLLTKD